RSTIRDVSAKASSLRSTITSASAVNARALARRRPPCVVRSSSPQQRRVGGLSTKSTIEGNLLCCRCSGKEYPDCLTNSVDSAAGRIRPSHKLVGMITIEDVNDALREVIDPELGLD